MKHPYFFAAALAFASLSASAAPALPDVASPIYPTMSWDFSSDKVENPGVFGLQISDLDIALNPTAEAAVMLYVNEEPVAYLTADSSSIEFYPGFAAAPDDDDAFGAGMPTQLYMNFGELPAEPGDYMLYFSPGFFTYNGEPMDEAQLTWHYTAEARVIDMFYDIIPEEFTTVHDFNEIKVTFTRVSELDYTKNVGTLRGPGGAFYTCEYPLLRGNSLIFSFSKYDDEFEDGDYTFSIRPNTVLVGYDDVSEHEPNFPGCNIAYKYVRLNESANLKDHLAYSVPDAYEANRANAHTVLHTGMSLISLACDNMEIVLNTECTDRIQMLYNGECIATLGLSGEEPVWFDGAGALDVNGLAQFQSGWFLNMLFVEPEHEDYPLFQRNGKYTVVIPNGAFKLGDKLLKGLSIEYNYTDEMPNVDFAYTLTPAPGKLAVSYADEENAITSKMLLGEIIVHFDNATSVDYAGDGGGHLYDEDFNEIHADYPKPNWVNEITYKFGNAKTEWPEEGIFTFVIDPKYVAVNLPYFDEYEDEANFPGLTAIYQLSENAQTSVTLVGAEATKNYNVFTIDGKAILTNAKPAALLDLTPGLYIINGVKTVVRK